MSLRLILPTAWEDVQHIPVKRPRARKGFKPCLQQLLSTRKMVQILLTDTWQDNKQKVTMQLLVSSSLPWKSHLVLKQTTWSLSFKEGSELFKFVPDEVAKLLMQAQWNQAPIRCYSLAQLFVPAEEAINWWWIGAWAREAMIYQHLQCQCSSTSWISTAKKIDQYWDLKSFSKTEEIEDHQDT